MTIYGIRGWFGSMVLPLRRYAQFKGRSGRREFWLYSLFLTLGYAAIMCAAVVVAMAADEENADTLIGWTVLAGWGLFFAVNFIPGIALTTRRLHDMGLSGALLIVIFAGLASLNVLGWLAYMVWMSLPPQHGANRHGLPPGQGDVAEVFR